MSQNLLLKWSSDQVHGAQQALHATALALRKLKKDAEKTKQVSNEQRSKHDQCLIA